MEMDMKLEEALERIKNWKRRIPSFVKNWNITKTEIKWKTETQCQMDGNL